MCSNNGCRKTSEEFSGMKDHTNDEHRNNSPVQFQFSYWILNSKDKRLVNRLNQTELKGPWGRQTVLSLPSVPCDKYSSIVYYCTLSLKYISIYLLPQPKVT